jgi:pyroglutamyl-peptidase
LSRILITGFGPFPGVPSNPTASLVRHLVKSRNLKFRGVERLGHVLPTQWGMLAGFRETIRACEPAAVLMFGLAGRRRKVTPETRALNRASVLRQDAKGQKATGFHLDKSALAFRRSTIDPVRMSAVMRRSGIKAGVSHDAGDYLCNALLWTALESGVPAIFVHVPLPRRSWRPKGSQKTSHPTENQLARAGEIALAMVIACVRTQTTDC